MNKLGLIVAASLFVLITACGQTPTYQSPLSSVSDTTNSAEQFEKSLQGTWSRQCSSAPVTVNGVSMVSYYKQTIAFAGADSSFGIVITNFFYSDGACTALTLIQKESFHVLDINPNGNGWSYEASIADQSYAPQTAQAAAALNTNLACGINQWAAGVSLLTTNTGCNTIGSGSVLDTLYLSQNVLYRSLDEVANPNVISGTIPQGAPYTKQF